MTRRLGILIIALSWLIGQGGSLAAEEIAMTFGMNNRGPFVRMTDGERMVYFDRYNPLGSYHTTRSPLWPQIGPYARWTGYGANGYPWNSRWPASRYQPYTPPFRADLYPCGYGRFPTGQPLPGRYGYPRYRPAPPAFASPCGGYFPRPGFAGTIFR